MKTDELIAQLASQAAPLRPLPSPAARALAWSVVAMASAAAGIVIFGARPDLDVVMGQTEFMWPLVAAIVTAGVAAGASLVLAVPGSERSPALRGSSLTLGALWALMLVVFVVRDGHGFAGATHWPICFIRVIAIGLAPAIVLIGMLRRAAPLRITWTSALAVTAAMAAGAMAAQIVCPIDDAAHALLGHFGPVLVLGLLGAATARRMLALRTTDRGPGL
jgi:hypothetical protein